MSEERKILTTAELELMNLVWKLEEASVRDVMLELEGKKELAYTSVSTILRILEKKGFLKSRKEGRGHLYSPLISQEAYRSFSVDHLVEKVFLKEPAALAKALLGSSSLKAKELEEIKALIDKELRK